MHVKEDGYNWIVRIEKGEELISTLTKFIKENDVPTCWVSGLGATSDVTLGFYWLDKQEYSWKKFEELMEVTSLQGNISWIDGEPMLHIHGSFSKSDMSAVGGHVKNLVAGGTLEIFLHRWYGDKLTRTQDDEIGLKLLDV